MRIIFLDVDGVLNNDVTEDRYQGWVGIDPVLVDNLKEIYDKSNESEETKIVVSTSWRYEIIRKGSYQDGSYDYLLKRLNEKGMVVLDMTPMDMYNGSYRGREIFAWLLLNKEKYGVTHYVILDDEAFDFYKYSDWAKRFVQISSEFGLTKTDALKAIQILTMNQYKLDH